MLGWILRLLFVVAGFITSIFVAHDALNFSVVQMVIAVLLFTLCMAIITFWSPLKNWIQRIFIKKKD